MRTYILIILLSIACLASAQHTLYYTKYKHYSEELANAAANGDVMAIVSLGSCYDRGEGVEVDRQKAFDCFLKAAGYGDILAKHNLALYYQRGFVTEPDDAKALALYEEIVAKDPKFQPALFNMVGIYEKSGTPSDREKAFRTWLTLASLGQPVAQYQAGRYYENGLGGVRDAEKAIDYYTLAANQEYLWAYDALASCYLSRRDFANAAEWLQKAYDKDFLIVCHNLGDLYYYGNGVKQSYKKAFEIFSRGVEKNPRCAYRMAIMYRDGLGVKKNLNLYTAFILQAAEKGIDRAQYLWACDKYAGSNTHRDYKEAVNYFQLALKSKFLSADIRKDICLKLSDCYRYGKGVGKDLAKADYYESEAGRL